VLGADSGLPYRDGCTLWPDADLATKIAVSIIPDERKPTRRARTLVLRRHRCTPRFRLLASRSRPSFGQHQARSVVGPTASSAARTRKVSTYPEGHSCPHCPLLGVAADRFTHERQSTNRTRGFLPPGCRGYPITSELAANPCQFNRSMQHHLIS